MCHVQSLDENISFCSESLTTAPILHPEPTITTDIDVVKVSVALIYCNYDWFNMLSVMEPVGIYGLDYRPVNLCNAVRHCPTHGIDVYINMGPCSHSPMMIIYH